MTLLNKLEALLPEERKLIDSSEYNTAWRTGFNFCRNEVKEKFLPAMLEMIKGEIMKIKDCGHNDDCIFCGVKDKKINDLLDLLK